MFQVLHSLLKFAPPHDEHPARHHVSDEPAFEVLHNGMDQACLSLKAKTFALQVTEGLMENRLCRWINIEEMKQLGQQLLDLAASLEKQKTEWEGESARVRGSDP